MYVFGQPESKVPSNTRGARGDLPRSPTMLIDYFGYSSSSQISFTSEFLVERVHVPRHPTSRVPNHTESTRGESTT